MTARSPGEVVVPFLPLAEFNTRQADDMRAALRACCDAPTWVAAVLDGRPYGSRDELLRRASELVRELRDSEIDGALAAHPRIGDRAEGEDREAAWSRLEQSGVDRDAETLRDLERANRAYEARFGHVCLICATGLSSAEILEAIRARLANDDETERRLLAEELGTIAALRLGRLVTES